MIRKRNGNERCKMKYYTNIFDRCADPIGIPHISRNNLDLLEDFFRKHVKPSPRVKRIIKYKCAYIAPLLQKTLDKMTADKSIRAGNKNFFILQFHIYSISIEILSYTKGFQSIREALSYYLRGYQRKVIFR